MCPTKHSEWSALQVKFVFKISFLGRLENQEILEVNNTEKRNASILCN